MDILVLNYNDVETTKQFINSVKNFNCIGTILVVDNCSTDNSYLELQQLAKDNVKVIKSNYNGGYGYGNNFGIRYLVEHSNEKFILLANPDTFIKEDVLLKLEAFLKKNNDYSIVAPFMCNKDGRKSSITAFRIPNCWEYIFSLTMFGKKFFSHLEYEDILTSKQKFRNVGSVAGSLYLMRKEDMLKYGMYDEDIFLFCEEVVLGIKMKRGMKKIALLCNEIFVHAHSVSIKKTLKSVMTRKKILNRSKLYVIKKYYNASFTQYIFAVILSYISLVELALYKHVKGMDE